MPIDTRSNRDERHRQAIIQYEKNTIEPALVKLISNNPSLENTSLYIEVSKEESEDKFTKNSYSIGRTNAANLGGNPKFILSVIKALYEEEGYEVGGVLSNNTEFFIEVKQS